MNTKNILVPFDRHSHDLKPLYHAFALAERMKAKIFVLFFKDEYSDYEHTSPLEKACLEMIHSACEDGIIVSFHIAIDEFEVELFNIIKTEHINLIVVGAGDIEMETAIKNIKPGISIQVIEVKGKNNINSI